MGQNEKRYELAQTRTLLVAERTFAAWIRIGLGGVAVGLAIARFVPLNTASQQRLAHIAGQLLVIWGGAIFIFAFWDYRRRYLGLTGKSVESARLIILSAIAAVAIVTAILLLWLTFTLL